MYTQLLILFALIFTGYALAKIEILTEPVTLGINKMIVFFAFPCLIVYKLGTMQLDEALKEDFLMVFLLGGASYIIFTVIAHVYYRLRGLTDKVSAPMMLCTCLSNNGFIGYPVALAFLGDKGLILMVAHGALVFNLYVYTYAISYLRNSARDYKLPMTPGRLLTQVMSIVLNPNIIAVALGMLIFATGFSLDNVVGDYLSIISDMASPLAMIYVGAMLAGSKFTDMFKDKLIWEATFVKLILIPALFFLMVLWLPIGDMAKAILILGVSFPSAAIPIMLGQQLGQDTRQAGQLLFLSTLLSMGTLPVVMELLTRLLSL